MCSRLCLVVTLVMLFALTNASAQGPVHIWSGGYGGTGLEYGTAVATDVFGNVVIAGYFHSTVNFGGGVLTSAGGSDICVAKLDAWGNHLWSHRFGDASDQRAFTVAVDINGNVMVAGDFRGTVNFGGGNLTSAGSYDIFIAKFDANGVHLWSDRYGDSSAQYAMSTTTDESGDVYMFGDFGGTLDFGGGPLTATANNDLYVVKFAGSNGLHVWSDSFPGEDYQWARTVAVDGAGNIFLTGWFEGTVNFGGGVLTDAGQGDVFLAKLGDRGAHVWSKRFGDSAIQNGMDVAVDLSGAVVMAGEFYGTVNFGGGILTSAGQDDIFVAKFDTDGNHVWSERYGAADRQRMRGVAVDGEGNITVTGYFENTLDFGGGPLTSAGGHDIFLATLDPDGNHQWSRRFGDSDQQYSEAVALDPSGGVAIAGTFHGTVDFAGSLQWSSQGASDIFAARFAYPPVGTCAGALLNLDPGTPMYYSGFFDEERGLYISALQDFEVCAFGIEMNPLLPVPLIAKIYEATGTTRGPLVASGEFMAAGPGLAVHYVPIHYVLQSCQDYDLTIQYGYPWDLRVFDENDFSLPFDEGGIIRVRDGELWGNPADPSMPLFSIIGAPLGCPQYADLGPPEVTWNPSTDAQGERGVYITAKKTIKVCALYWEADISTPPATLIGRIYEATGTTRGPLVASGVGVAEVSGMTMHMIPISAVLEEGKEYDLVVEFEPTWWASIGEDQITIPYDVGDIITVRDGEQGGNPANTILTHFAMNWSPDVAGAPFDLGKHAEGYPPPFSSTLSNTNYGMYVTSLIDQEIYSLGWKANVQQGEAMYAWVFEAAGISRGALISQGSIVCGSDGMRWHDIPVAADLQNGADYNIEFGFGQVNEWRYWEDYTGLPYNAYGLFSVYSSSQGGSPNFHKLPYMRVNACNIVGTAVEDRAVQPPRFTLGAPHPNPATESTTIPYSLDEGGPVTIAVYDVAGRRVTVLLEGARQPSGPGTVELDSSKLAAGVYFVKMQNEQKSVSRKITIVR